MKIQCYQDFIDALLYCGFSMGGSNSEGIFAIIPWDWRSDPPYDTPVRWHMEDPETDPWEWRMRVLDERNDIAYGKVFFKKSGYITKHWYPYFLAVRRKGISFEEAYAAGKISLAAKRIYTVIRSHRAVPLHLIKQLSGFGKEEKAAFERALTELQMTLYITMCGKQQKLSRKGEEYGWSSTVFCTTEQFWGEETFHIAADITEQEAFEAITGQVCRLNPQADPKKVLKFIRG